MDSVSAHKYAAAPLRSFFTIAFSGAVFGMLWFIILAGYLNLLPI